MKPQIIVLKNKKLNIIINKMIWAIHEDVSYNYGGWLFFLGRMSVNLFILFYVLNFIEIFFTFIWEYYGIEKIKQESLSLILWVVAVVYLITKIPLWKEENGTNSVS